MPMLFKKDDEVRQVVKPIEGRVVRPEIVNDEVQYLVVWNDDEGEHSRYFTESEIELKSV